MKRTLPSLAAAIVLLGMLMIGLGVNGLNVTRPWPHHTQVITFIPDPTPTASRTSP